MIPDTPEARDMVSTLGEREYRGVPARVFSGGKEVWRRGCEALEVVESMDAFRRLFAGAEEGISDCLLFGG